MLFQLADSCQAIHGVSGKTADGFGNDKVDSAVQGVRNHLIETIAVFGVRTGDAFVRIHLDETPLRIAVDIIGVVVHLRLIACELLIAVRRNTGISGYSAPGDLFHWTAGLGIECGGNHCHIFCCCHVSTSCAKS